MQMPRRHDITWFVEAICAATAVSGAAQVANAQPSPVGPRCRVVDPRSLVTRAKRAEAIALPPARAEAA